MNTILLRIGLVLCALSPVHTVFGQVVYYVNELQELRYLELNTCKDTLITKTINPSGPGASAFDVAVSPNGAFYLVFPGTTYDLYEVNPQTGQMTFLTKFDKPIRGLVCDNKGVVWAGGFALYSYDPATGTQVSYGDFTWIAGEIVGGDLTFRNGQLYMIDAFSRVREVNLTPPLAGKIIQDISGTANLGNLYGLFSIYYACDSVVTYTTGSTPFSNLPKMAQVNFETGAVTPIACNFPQGATMTGATTPLEFLGSVPCLHEFDLDTDNSSGAAGKDYTLPLNTCATNGVFIADTDLKLQYYKPIDSIQMHFLPGSFAPDGDKEALLAFHTGTSSNFKWSGQQTHQVSVWSYPPAPDSVFQDILASTVYYNLSPIPTPGIRTIRTILWAGGKAIDTALTTINLPATPVTNLTLQACPGSTATYDSTVLAVGDVRAFKYTSWLGCDSIVTVTVAALPTSNSDLNVKACPGSSYTYAGQQVPTGTSQTFKLQNWLGCDSLVTVNVGPLPISILNLAVKTCPGTTYKYAGVDLSIGATQSFKFQNWQGCDSIVMVTVGALPASSSSLTLKACPGSTVAYGGVDLAVGDVRDFKETNWLGCDSVVTVTVAALPTSASSLTLKTCPGSTVAYGGVDLAVGDVRDFKETNWLGCDSVVTVTVAALPTSASSLTLKACPGSTVPYGGVDLAVGDVRDFKKTNWLGCDSVVTVTVAALPTSASSLTLKTCLGSTVAYGGVDLAVGDVRDFKETNWLGCDSVVTVTVAALPTSASSLTLKTCLGSTVAYGGANLSVGATQSFTFKNWLGCDSTVTVTVATLPVFSVVLNVKTCPGATYVYQGVPLAAGETRDFVLKSHADCDSTVTVSVTAWPDLAFGIVPKKSCANASSGSLTVQNLVGGASPFAYSLDGAGFQSSPDFAGLAAGTYALRVRDGNQCVFEDTASVGEHGALEVSLADAVLACDAASVRLAPAVSGDLTGVQFKWSDGSQSASLEATAAGKFWVEVFNVCQKIRRDAVVRWNDFGGDTSLVYVPNVFSPHAERPENSRFRPFFSPHLTVVEYQLEVYDRWGGLVFRSEDPERSWEAVAHHRLDDAGAVYVWQLQARVIVCGREMLLRRQGDVAVTK